MEGSGLSEPPPPPLFSPPPSLSLALPPPRTLRRREGELPGVLRGELLAVLDEKDKRKTVSSGENRGIPLIFTGGAGLRSPSYSITAISNCRLRPRGRPREAR